MKMSRTNLLASVAASALTLGAPMAVTAQVSEPETTTTAAQESRLSCQAEIRALRDTVRSEPEYESFANEFEGMIERASVEADQGVCLVRLLEAQQFLVGQGVVLEGYSDEATIYATLAAAQDAGAMTNMDAADASTSVSVEARPARVAVTPEAAQVTIQREATDVAVEQQASEIVVEQPQSTVSVEQAQPNIDVVQPEANVSVDAPAPEVEVVQPAPDIEVEQAQPEVDVAQSQPKVTIDQPQPEVTIRQFQPEVTITQPAPDISVEQSEPQIAVVQPEPEVTVESAEPIVTVEQAEPDVNVDYAEPTVDVTQREPQVSVEAEQPDVQVAEAAPEVSVSQGEPTVNVSQAEPIVNVDQDEATVEVAQGEAQVSTEMEEAQVALNAESGADVSTMREQGVDVALNLEDEGDIERAALVAEADLIALEEVEFRFDSAELTDVAMSNIADAGDVLGEGDVALLVGYASPVGDAAYNQDLSERRVESVRQAMLGMGVSADQIRTRAAGENQAEAAANATERSEENRRVEIRVIPEALVQ